MPEHGDVNALGRVLRLLLVDRGVALLLGLLPFLVLPLVLLQALLGLPSNHGLHPGGILDLLVETDEVEQGVRHRAARLYRFDRRKYERLARQGFEFAM